MSPRVSFEWGKMLIPGYIWFNSNTTYITPDDIFDPNCVVTINTLNSDINDPNAVIFPTHKFGCLQPR